jgi:hypothetical protein
MTRARLAWTGPASTTRRGFGRQWAWLMALTVPMAHAEQNVLDDRGSYTDPPHLTLQWRSLGAGGGAGVMEGRARLALRLDTREHAGKTARIYMAMSPTVRPGLVLQWQSRGRLLGGRIAPGERVLVYRGVIPGPVLEDELALFFSADGDWGGDLSRVQCRYEVELER